MQCRILHEFYHIESETRHTHTHMISYISHTHTYIYILYSKCGILIFVWRGVHCHIVMHSCWMLLVQAHKREGLPARMVPRRCDGRHVGAEGRGGSEKNDAHPQETTDLPAINIDKYRYFMIFPYVSCKNALTP